MQQRLSWGDCGMNAQLEQQIQADFPFMKLNKIDGEENLYRRWGCDCDDGWYNLIHDMCQAIADRYAEEGLPIDLIPTQLKEKFATLRFYYSFEGAQYGSAAIDFLGGLSIRFEANDETPLDERTEILRRDIAQIIRTYEARTRLLIIHGTADDNVHFQNTVEMTRALNRAGKQYDMMVYPDQNHSMLPDATAHIRQKMIDYTLKNL